MSLIITVDKMEKQKKKISHRQNSSKIKPASVNMDQIETILRLLQIKLQEYTKTAKIQLRAIFHIDLKNLTSTCRFNNISSCYKIL
jgi:hypothetical protein